ncbi:MAG: preprotein translocase subunit YajC [Planctomycetes bacterium]|nr:preprotein translocase subunit YajC [Planctomycetota bacterium]
MSDIWVRAALAQENTEGGEGTELTSDAGQDKPETSVGVDSSADQKDKGNDDQTETRNPWMQMLPFILIFVVMYLFLFRGPKKKQAEHKKMLSSLQKNDRVRTIGGILGTVIDIKDDEVTLKVDESNNTKIKVTTGSIGAVLSDRDK